MKNATKITALLSAGALLFNVATTSVMAGPFGGHIGIGVSLTAAEATTTASETLKGNSTVTGPKTHKNVGGYDAYWAQYTFGDDGFVIGYEKIGKDIPLGNGLRNVVGSAEVDRPDTGDQRVKAAIADHTTWYIESPGLGFDGGLFGGNGGLFIKYAQSKATLRTMEELHTQGQYPDADVNADTLGIGFKTGTAGGVMFKAVYEETEFDAISLTSAATNGGAGNVVTSPGTEVNAIKVSLGFSF